MKKIQKETTREIKEVFTCYVASDGTEFTVEEECKKYEESAIGVLFAKTKEFEIARGWDSEWFDISEDNEYRTLVPKTEDDIDVLNQIYFIFNGVKDREGKEREAKFSYKDIDKPVLMGFRWYNESIEWAWFYKFDYIIYQATGGNYQLEPCTCKS